MKYTNEQALELTKMYTSGDYTIEQIAEHFQVPTKSVIAKLSNLGIYKKQVYLTKRGEIPKSKEVLIQELAGLLNVELDRLESLEKVNKSVLNLLIQKVSE